MNGEQEFVDYAERLEAFRESDAERDALFARIIQSYEKLNEDYAQQGEDLKNEVASRRLWQSKATLSDRALAEQKQVSGSNNFVIAIIDGDGAIFRDSLFAIGKEGGAEAAHLLHQEIQTYLKEMYPDSNVSDWTIVVQIFLNLHGLSHKLLSCNILSSSNGLSAFGHAFSLARPLFSFVDVGGGKEHADHKIRETLRLYVPITQCKHIFFGPCHDNGYLPCLTPYKGDRSTARRLTLIETRPAEPGFMDLGLRRIQMPQIFRADDLPNRPPPVPATTTITTTLRTKTPPVAPTNGSIAVPTKAYSTSASDSGASGEAKSWANVGKNGGVSKNVDIGPRKSTPQPRRYITLNAYDQRLDPDLPKKDHNAENAVHDRMRKWGNFCNDHHISGRCALGEACPYHHGERLVGGELLVLKYKARNRQCPSRSECRNLDCSFGHHCKLGKQCFFNNCFFANTHNMDLEPAKRMFSDGEEEWLQPYLDKCRQ